MLPKWHILFGIIFSLILYLFFQISLLNSLIVFLASILIDVDHYLSHAFKEKDLSLKRIYKSSVKRREKWMNFSVKEKKEYKLRPFIFHGIEFWIVILVLSFFHKIFLYIFLGIMIHMFFDFIDMIYCKDPFYAKLSQIYIWIRNKNKKDPAF